MRILLISNLYPSSEHPAFGTFIAARAETLRRAGVSVEVVAITDPGVHTRIVRKYASLGGRAVLAAIRSLVARRPFDVVEAHIAYPTGLLAWPVARLLRARLVLFAHGSDVMDIPGRSGRHARAARRLYRSADVIVANSAFLAGELQARVAPPPGRVRVISPGIDLAAFGAAGQEPRRGILFVGRLLPRKGLHVLLDALATLPPDVWAPPLEIIGDGPDLGASRAHAERIGVPVDFRGPLPPAAVAEAMGRAEVVAVPSAYEEGLGLVALEAMAAGAVVVASAVGGHRETVQDGVTGFLVIRDDAAALATALVRGLAVARSGEPAGLRDAAQTMAARHDITRTVAQSVELYRTMGA